MKRHRPTTSAALALVLSVSAVTVDLPRAEDGAGTADLGSGASIVDTGGSDAATTGLAQSVFAGYDGAVLGMELRLGGAATLAGDGERLSLTLRRFDGAGSALALSGASTDLDDAVVDLGADAATALTRVGIDADRARPEDWREELRLDIDDADGDGPSGVVRVGADRMSFGVDPNGGADPLLVVDVNGRSASLPAGVIRALATGETDGISPFELDEARRALERLGDAVVDPAGMAEIGAGYGAVLPLLMARLQASGDALRCVVPCLGCVGAIITYVGSVAAVIATCGAAVVSAGALTPACVAALILHFGAMVLSLSACGGCFQCIG